MELQTFQAITERTLSRLGCRRIVGCVLRGTVVERRSVIGELSLSYARPAADR